MDSDIQFSLHVAQVSIGTIADVFKAGTAFVAAWGRGLS
jgi:hypothetical protein